MDKDHNEDDRSAVELVDLIASAISRIPQLELQSPFQLVISLNEAVVESKEDRHFVSQEIADFLRVVCSIVRNRSNLLLLLQCFEYCEAQSEISNRAKSSRIQELFACLLKMFVATAPIVRRWAIKAAWHLVRSFENLPSKLSSLFPGIDFAQRLSSYESISFEILLTEGTCVQVESAKKIHQPNTILSAAFAKELLQCMVIIERRKQKAEDNNSAFVLGSTSTSTGTTERLSKKEQYNSSSGITDEEYSSANLGSYHSQNKYLHGLARNRKSGGMQTDSKKVFGLQSVSKLRPRATISIASSLYSDREKVENFGTLSVHSRRFSLGRNTANLKNVGTSFPSKLSDCQDSVLPQGKPLTANRLSDLKASGVGEIRASILSRIQKPKDSGLSRILFDEGESRSTGLSTSLTLNSIHTFNTEIDLPNSLYEIDLDEYGSYIAIHRNSNFGEQRSNEKPNKKNPLKRRNSAFFDSNNGIHAMDCLSIMEILLGDPVLPLDSKHMLLCNGYDQHLRSKAIELLPTLLHILALASNDVATAKTLGSLCSLFDSREENLDQLLTIKGWKIYFLRLFHSVPADLDFRSIIQELIFQHASAIIISGLCHQMKHSTHETGLTLLGNFMYEVAIVSGWTEESVRFVSCIMKMLLNEAQRHSLDMVEEVLKMVEIFAIYMPLEGQSINTNTKHDRQDFDESEFECNDNYVWRPVLPRCSVMSTSENRIDFIGFSNPPYGVQGFGLHLNDESQNIDKELVKSALGSRSRFDQDGSDSAKLSCCPKRIFNRLKQISIAQDNIDALVDEYQERRDDITDAEATELSDTISSIQRNLLHSRLSKSKLFGESCSICSTFSFLDKNLLHSVDKEICYSGISVAVILPETFVGVVSVPEHSLRSHKLDNYIQFFEKDGTFSVDSDSSLKSELFSKCPGCKLDTNSPTSDEVLKRCSHMWHADHLRCTSCNKSLKRDSDREMVFTPEGWLFCLECHENHTSNCPCCGKAPSPESSVFVQGSSRSPMPQAWHKEHFSCEICSRKLTEGFYSTVRGPIYPVYCEEHASSEFAYKCRTCRNSIVDGEFIKFPGLMLTVHNTKACFSCSNCGDALDLPSNCFVLLSEGTIFCKACFSLFSFGNCLICKESFRMGTNESVVIALGSARLFLDIDTDIRCGYDGHLRAHKKCFKCDRCKNTSILPGSTCYIEPYTETSNEKVKLVNLYCLEHGRKRCKELESSKVSEFDQIEVGNKPVFYYVDKGRQQQGPIPLEDLSKLVADSVISSTTLIWAPGMDAWCPLESLEF